MQLNTVDGSVMVRVRQTKKLVYSEKRLFPQTNSEKPRMTIKALTSSVTITYNYNKYKMDFEY